MHECERSRTRAVIEDNESIRGKRWAAEKGGGNQEGVGGEACVVDMAVQSLAVGLPDISHNAPEKPGHKCRRANHGHPISPIRRRRAKTLCPNPEAIGDLHFD